MPVDPTVSLVIPVYNAQATIKDCLDSVLALDFPKDELEIILVDNNSTDDTKEIIKKYPVKYIFEPQKGRAFARNAGIREARGAFIAFTDADCVVDINWLKELKKGFENESIVACGGKVLAYGKTNWIQDYIQESCTLAQEGTYNDDNPRFLERVVTANAIFRRGIFGKLGYFDENFSTGEDSEMGYRIWLYWHMMKYIPQAIVYHCHVRNLNKFCRWHFDYGKFCYANYRKYQAIFNYGITPKLIVGAFLMLIVNLIKSVGKSIAQNKNISFIFLQVLQLVLFVYGRLFYCFWDIYIKPIDVSSNAVLDINVKRDVCLKYDGSNWFVNKSIFCLSQGNKSILYNMQTYSYFMLNEVGIMVWRSIIKEQAFDEMFLKIATRYEISASQAKEDVEYFLNELVQQDIICRR